MTSAGRSSAVSAAGATSWTRLRLRSPVAHHDPRLAGDGPERVMEAGGHDRLAAGAEDVLVAVVAQAHAAVDHAQQRVFPRTHTQRCLFREGLEDERHAV